MLHLSVPRPLVLFLQICPWPHPIETVQEAIRALAEGHLVTLVRELTKLSTVVLRLQEHAAQERCPVYFTLTQQRGRKRPGSSSISDEGHSTRKDKIDHPRW